MNTRYPTKISMEEASNSLRNTPQNMRKPLSRKIAPRILMVLT